MNTSVSVDWTRMTPGELLGHRFLARDMRGQTVDGALSVVHQRSGYVEMGMMPQRVPVVKVPTPPKTLRTDYGEDPRHELVAPFTAVNVLEERL
ncbi:hypothetical protein KIH77_08705 [Bifidobacterium sp. 82T24]|uniref:hypothetical protein n=1 Tax=Bifidobacterium pluvialisilvae TaxID=2834436 RepID=UPI001C5602EF|nr:hypothetical protein [Bifidobacterium pluvialisilvae]MBW3088802.1 hypothetical protein [Bifidobacterium pluvialisilvae]